MDTATHLVMGVTLGSLATLDPAIAQSDIGPQAVMLATIAGSNIPDIDTVLKLRNNAKYIRNHRGITHFHSCSDSLVFPYKWHLFRLLFRRSIFASTTLVLYCRLSSCLCRYF